MLAGNYIDLKNKIWSVVSDHLRLSEQGKIYSEEEAMLMVQRLSELREPIQEMFGVRLRSNPSSNVKTVNHLLQTVFNIKASCCKQQMTKRVRQRTYYIHSDSLQHLYKQSTGFISQNYY